MLAIFVVIGIGVSLDINPSLSSLPTPSIDSSDIVGLGSCIAHGNAIDLRRALFLENRTLEFDHSSGHLRASLIGQTIRIERLSPSADQSIYVQDVGESVSEAGHVADIDLKFALLESRLVVYWRETSQHHIYRQGVFQVNGQNLRVLCEGSAGSETSH